MTTDLVATYRQAIHVWTQDLLSPYTESLRGMPVGSCSAVKEFNDPVWGTLILHGHEVAIVDSPLLQRLRRIRQLGVAHYVYPAAQHTRFEHSLGVAHQIDRLLDGVDRHPFKGAASLSPEEFRPLLRIAALCHDVGHGLMSHVVENALRANRDIIRLQTAYQKTLQLDKTPQLSEIAAYEMLCSPAFEELIEASARVADKSLGPDAHQRIADFVVGRPVAEKFPMLHELLTGPFDADKLDYLPRDALMCGVPVVTDVTRLIQKVRGVCCSRSELPTELADVAEAEIIHVTGVAHSGASSLDELALARSLMADKIYRHHKVRAVESMVAGVLEQVGHLIDAYVPTLPLRLLDDQLFDLTPEKISAGRELSDDDVLRSQIACDIVRRLRDRRLYVRAFAFAQKMPDDAYKTDEIQKRAMETFIRTHSDDAQLRSQFLDQVAEVADEIMSLTGRLQAELADLPGGRLRPFLALDTPTGKPGDLAPLTGRAWLVGSDGQLGLAREANAETQGWADAYVSTRHLGHVFAPREFAQVVHLAVESTLRSVHQVRVPRTMLDYAKQDRKRLDDFRDELQGLGFYEGSRFDLRPTAKALRRQADRRLQKLADDLGQYAPPVGQRSRDGRLEGASLKAGRLRDYLRQYEDDLAEAGLRVLENVLFLSRAELNKAVTTFFEANPAFAGASVCPLGEPRDASTALAYMIDDSSRELGYAVRSLNEALQRDDPIVFFDDFVGLGNSAISILEAHLDAEPTTHLGEGERPALSEWHQRRLRELPLGLCAAAGLDDGLAAISSAATRLGLNMHSPWAAHPQGSLPTFRGALADFGPDHVDQFADFASEVGRAVLEDPTAPEHDAAWRDERALGYGNHGLLVVSAMNTPSATMTCLWAGGTFRGRQWTPIFPRRKKRAPVNVARGGAVA